VGDAISQRLQADGFFPSNLKNWLSAYFKYMFTASKIIVQ
jgi:hypothetical protein